MSGDVGSLPPPEASTPSTGQPLAPQTGKIPGTVKIVVYKGMGGVSNALASMPGLGKIVQGGSLLGYACTKGCQELAQKLNELSTPDIVADASRAVSRGTDTTVKALTTAGGAVTSALGIAYTGLAAAGETVAPWVRAAIVNIPKVGPSVVQGMDTAGHTIASAAEKAAPVVRAAGSVIPPVANMALGATAWGFKSAAALAFGTIGLGFAGSRLVARGIAKVTGADEKVEELAQTFKKTSEHPEKVQESLLSYASSCYTFAKESDQQMVQEMEKLQPQPTEENGLSPEAKKAKEFLNLSTEDQSSVLFLLKTAGKINKATSEEYESLLQQHRNSPALTDEVMQTAKAIAKGYNDLTEAEKQKLTPQQYNALDEFQKPHLLDIVGRHSSKWEMETVFNNNNNTEALLERFNQLSETEKNRLFCELTTGEIEALTAEERATVIESIKARVEQLPDEKKKRSVEDQIKNLLKDDVENLQKLAKKYLSDDERATIKQLKREEITVYEFTLDELQAGIAVLEKQRAANPESDDAMELTRLMATMIGEANAQEVFPSTTTELPIEKQDNGKPIVTTEETSESEEEFPPVLVEIETIETPSIVTLSEQPVKEPTDTFFKTTVTTKIKIPPAPKIPPPPTDSPPPLPSSVRITSPTKPLTMGQRIAKVMKSVRGFFHMVGKGITWPFRQAGKQIRKLLKKEKH